MVGLLRHGSAGLYTSLGMYYLGLAVLVIAWLVLGRLLLSGSADRLTGTSSDAGTGTWPAKCSARPRCAGC